MSYLTSITLLGLYLSNGGAIVSLNCPFADLDFGHKINDPYEVVYVPVGETVELPCCQRRKTANQSWIIRDRFFMDHDSDVVRTPPAKIDALSVTQNGSLIIKNMSTTYSFAYYCKRLQDNVKFDSNTFVFFVDVRNPKQGTVQGGVDAYLEYKKKYLDPIRKYIKHSTDQNFRNLLQGTGLGMTIKLEWTPWSECNTCTGLKTRFGRCRLAPYVADPKKICNWRCQMYKYSLNLECASSWSFRGIFTVLATKTEGIPNFRSVVKCIGPCAGDKIPDKSQRTRLMYVGNSLTLTCPDYTPQKNCFWRKDGIKLVVEDYDPGKKISVNEFCTVFIREATNAESGNFTCYVNDVRKQENKVIVEENYSEKEASWWRHFKYLWYIVLTCFVILIGGIAIGCVQRSNFKRIDAEQVLRAYGEKRFEYERLLPKE